MDDRSRTKAIRAMETARTRLVLDSPFFGSLLVSTRAIPSDRVDHLWTDGERVLFNPEFVASQTEKALITLNAHIVMHPALGHNFRLKDLKSTPGFDHEVATEAADYVVNLLLKEEGFEDPADIDWLCDNRFHGKSFEQVYRILLQEKPKMPQSSGDDETEEDESQSEGSDQSSSGDSDDDGDQEQESESESPSGSSEDDESSDEESSQSEDSESNEDQNGDSDGDDDDGDQDQDDEGKNDDDPGNDQGKSFSSSNVMNDIGEKPDNEEIDDANDEREWSNNFANAVNTARLAGKCPAGLDRIIEQKKEKRDGWELLRRFVQVNTPSDYSWAKLNRNYLQYDIMVPSLYAKKLGRIFVGFDTSMSMTQEQVIEIGHNLNSIVEDFDCDMTVIYCDRIVYPEAIQEFAKSDCPISLNPKGGGGTAFLPVFKHIETMDDEPVCMIYFTDLEGNVDELLQPDYPVIWAKVVPKKGYSSHWAGTPKFGEIVEIEFKGGYH